MSSIKPILCAAFALLCIAIFLPGCSPEDPFVPHRTGDTTNRNKGAFLRVVHAAADGPKVDVLVDSAKFFPQSQGYLDFNEANNNGRYYPVDSLAKKISFRNGGTTVAEGTLALVKGRFYTAYLYGSADKGYKVLVSADSIEKSTDPTKRTKYRIVHLSPDSPTLDIRQDSEQTVPVITGLDYGKASQYILTKEHVAPGTGLFIYDHVSGDTIRRLTKPYVLLPPNATFTIVLTGKADPRGDDPFLLFSLFQESSLGADSLYGATPININFAAMRFVNLAASGDSLLDVTFYDPSSEFACNENFRRNYVDQYLNMEAVASLGLLGQATHRHYFYLSLLLKQDYPYRVEFHQSWQPSCRADQHPFVYRRQDVLVPRQEFTAQPNKRYTLVTYGPYKRDSAHAAIMVDNTPAPPAGMVQVRFFHGAFGQSAAGDLEKKRLRLQINGVATPTSLFYGQLPDGRNSFTTAPGDPVAQVIDDAGTVIHEEKLELTPLKENKAYTIFLSRGPQGTGFHLHALAEDFNP